MKWLPPAPTPTSGLMALTGQPSATVPIPQRTFTGSRTGRLAELGKGLAEVVVDDWAASSGHLKNILNDGLSEIGVGLARGMNAAGEDCWYCVQIFAYEGYHVTWVDNPVE